MHTVNTLQQVMGFAYWKNSVPYHLQSLLVSDASSRGKLHKRQYVKVQE
jgi:hypothetical protein